MTVPEQRVGELRGLLADIASDLYAARRLMLALTPTRIEGLNDSTDELELLGVAACLHHAYTAYESALQRIATAVDGALPAGDQWHAQLLIRMANPMPDTRPAVISNGTRLRLDELRRFRHLFRHGYAVEIEVQRLQSLAENLAPLAEQVSAEFESFTAFVRELIRRLEGSPAKPSPDR